MPVAVPAASLAAWSPSPWMTGPLSGDLQRMTKAMLVGTIFALARQGPPDVVAPCFGLASMHGWTEFRSIPSPNEDI